MYNHKGKQFLSEQLHHILCMWGDVGGKEAIISSQKSKRFRYDSKCNRSKTDRNKLKYMRFTQLMAK